MGEGKRKTPNTMPDDQAVISASVGLKVPILLAGSRGERRIREPDFDVHSEYSVRGGDLADLKDKHVLIFVHGYNVNRSEALNSTAEFFKQMQAALERDGADLLTFGYVGFTWPGDVGPVWFNDAQEFAQHSGVALYKLVREVAEKHKAKQITLVTHSLGAHVGLRSASILGERVFREKTSTRYTNVLLLAPAVENDVFRRPKALEQYHFPESGFGIHHLHIFASRADQVLKVAFATSELDAALGFAGPESMSPLKSLSQRVTHVLGDEAEFTFELHDFSPTSTVIMNPALHVGHHGDYWTRSEQADYYVNLINQ